MDGFLLRREHSSEPKKCAKCGEPLEPRVDGKRPTLNGKEVCSGCYSEEVGSFVEKRPISTPGRRGPGGQANLG